MLTFEVRVTKGFLIYLEARNPEDALLIVKAWGYTPTSILQY